MVRLISLTLFLAIWWLASLFAGPQMLPGPVKVLTAIAVQAQSGDLFFQLGVTLARVLAAFMIAGTAIGLLMGRVKIADRIGDPWLIVLLNLPALVIIVLAFIWGGLTEIAASSLWQSTNCRTPWSRCGRAHAPSIRALTKWRGSLRCRAENTCGTSYFRSSDPISLQQDAPAFPWCGRSC